MNTLNEIRKLAGLPLMEEERTRNFNEMMRQAKSVKMDLRGGREDLDPHLEIILKNGDMVYISADPDGKTIDWCYEDEAGADAP